MRLAQIANQAGPGSHVVLAEWPDGRVVTRPFEKPSPPRMTGIMMNLCRKGKKRTLLKEGWISFDPDADEPCIFSFHGQTKGGDGMLKWFIEHTAVRFMIPDDHEHLRRSLERTEPTPGTLLFDAEAWLLLGETSPVWWPTQRFNEWYRTAATMTK